MSTRPNIIYILADDMGYGDVSCLNPESRIRTPNIDRLAAEGVAYRDAHASSAVCTPSRYSILTGRYCWRSSLKEGVGDGYSGPLIERGRVTVASLLRDSGYRTGAVGKWHLGWTWPRMSERPDEVDFGRPILDGPCSVGFEYYFGISASLDMPPYVYVENERVTAAPDRIVPGGTGKLLQREGPTGADFVHADVLPTLGSKALEFIERWTEDQRPFFLYLPLTAPHTPILPSPEFQGRSGTNEYGDFCLQIDHLVGQILDALDRLGVADDTIVMFASDNGSSPNAGFAELAELGHHPSYVYRGHKFDIWEGGHRIPLLARWPAVIGAGGVLDQTVCLSDLLATCAEIVGVDLPPDAGEDSVSHLGMWTGGTLDPSMREATIHHSFDGSFAIRRGRWKLEMCPWSGGREGPRWSDEDRGGLPAIQLYDLDADIGERRNLQAERPEVVAELTALLTRYVVEGRSTAGPARAVGAVPSADWPHLWWMLRER
ncbi:MAG: arylsulfatase [Chloroflexota bacterium]